MMKNVKASSDNMSSEWQNGQDVFKKGRKSYNSRGFTIFKPVKLKENAPKTIPN